MKELSIEEKAKLYDKALERAKNTIEVNQAIPDIVECVESLFPELAESKDEKIRKALIKYFSEGMEYLSIIPYNKEQCVAWLEKQGSQNLANSAKTCKDGQNTVVAIPKFRVGYVIRPKGSTTEYTIESISGGCYRGNLWRLPIGCDDDYELVAQKPDDKVEPKFKIGDIITNGKIIGKVDENDNNKYHGWFGYDKDLSVLYADIPDIENWHKWTIQDAKAGDVLSFNDGHGNDCIELIKSITGKKIEFWFCLTNGNRYEVFDEITPYTNLISREGATPATKEQRDLLFQKMTEAGYTFDFEKKELKKIEEEINGEDYGIDSLFHAQRILEKTLGKVDGYQSDDGILEHKCAISAVKKLYEQKPTEWSEEDEKMMKVIIEDIYCGADFNAIVKCEADKRVYWLKHLKDKMQPQLQWKPSDEQMKALDSALSLAKNCGEESAFDLRTLYEQLKQL